MSGTEDPKLPFPHETRRNESTRNILKKLRVSVQRVFLHVFESRLTVRQLSTSIAIVLISLNLFLLRLFAKLPFVLARVLRKGITHWA